MEDSWLLAYLHLGVDQPNSTFKKKKKKGRYSKA